MGAKKKKIKKVNQLTIKECEKILVNLDSNSNNKYYVDVFKHYHNLILNKSKHDSGQTNQTSSSGISEQTQQ